MQEIGALAAGEQASTDDQAWSLQKLQRVIDQWDSERTKVYANTFTSFALSPNSTPTTIGPTGIFAVNQRPIEIPSIGLQLINTNPTTVEIPLSPRDKDWWAAQRVKNLTSAIPTDYYYEPDWPNGNIWFWPVPNAANNVLVQQRTVLGQITAYGQSFSMPPAYWNLIIYELAISLCPSFVRTASPELLSLWRAAVKAVEGNNIKSPRGVTGDVGMPGVRAIGGDFNYYSGGPNQR